MISWSSYKSDIKSLISNMTSKDEAAFAKSFTNITTTKVLANAADDYGNKLIPNNLDAMEIAIRLGALKSKSTGNSSNFIKSVSTGLMIIMNSSTLEFDNTPPSTVGVSNIINFPGISINIELKNYDNPDIFCNIMEIILKSFLANVKGILTYTTQSGATVPQSWSGLK